MIPQFPQEYLFRFSQKKKNSSKVENSSCNSTNKSWFFQKFYMELFKKILHELLKIFLHEFLSKNHSEIPSEVIPALSWKILLNIHSETVDLPLPLYFIQLDISLRIVQKKNKNKKLSKFIRTWEISPVIPSYICIWVQFFEG